MYLDENNHIIETGLMQEGRSSWNIRIRPMNIEMQKDRALMESLELLLQCPEDCLDYSILPEQVEYAEILLFPPSSGKKEHVRYVIARLSDNQGYLAVNEKHFFYALTKDGVIEFLDRMNRSPENPCKEGLRYCSTTAA